MKCLFFDLPINVRVEDISQKSMPDILREIGGNSGNLLFRYAIRSHVVDDLIPCHWKEGLELSENESEFDAVVIAASNLLHSTLEFGNGKRAKAIRKIGLPTICIGLGCQHHETTYDKISFPLETVDFLESLKEVNALILVRDEMTLIQCQHYGLKNIYLTGCPSNFINFDVRLNEQLEEKSYKEKHNRVILNGGHFTGETLAVDLLLLPLTKYLPKSYVIQNNSHKIAAMALKKVDEYSQADIRFFKRKFGFGLPFLALGGDKAYSQWLQQLSFFTDVEEWLNEARTWDFVIGTRLHGNMAALQSGTPGILITSDSRTEGLSKVMKIPSLSTKQILELNLNDTRKLFDYAKPDWKDYNINRLALAKTYSEILEKFGLELSENFKKLIT